MPTQKLRAILLSLVLLSATLAACDTTTPPTLTPILPSATPVPPTATQAPRPTATKAPAPTATAAVPLVAIRFDVTLPDNTPNGEPIFVNGNFQTTRPRDAPLTRNGNHATGVVNAVDGRDLSFHFTHGLLGSRESQANCTTSTERHAQATAGAAITATVVAWVDRCTPIYDTRVQRIPLVSRTLVLVKDIYVYTPPGYDQAKDTRYPVLYLFRGHEREWINKNEDSSRGGQNVIDVYETLLAAHQVGPMILVFPGMSSTDDSVSSMLTDMGGTRLTHAEGIGTGKYESFFLHDVMSYVDGHYRTIANRAGRGVDGFSLGGFMSTKIAAQYPDLFSTVGAFDGLYFYADSACKTIDTTRDTVFTRQDFWPVFGNPPDLKFAAANNPANLICNSTAEKMGQLHWFIQYGPESGEPDDANYYRGVYLLQQLQAKGVQDGITPVLTGGHNWATADEHMRATLPLHWAVFSQAVNNP